ncbi:MAG: hypothetical protein U5Q03_20190 [Bacteroidota bacterium]|nr:hypothetical protein [Bacteroidota bacterium]
MKTLVYFLFLLLFSLTSSAQEVLKPGFDPLEYKTMLELYARQADSIARPIDLPYPKDYSIVYRSEVSGLDNRWDLWINEKRMIAVISIRATTAKMDSWLENFYAGMIPATGALKFGEHDVFHYQLAQDSNAYVHAGWMIGLSVLAPDIVEKINAYYLKGYRDYIISLSIKSFRILKNPPTQKVLIMWYAAVPLSCWQERTIT